MNKMYIYFGDVLSLNSVQNILPYFRRLADNANFLLGIIGIWRNSESYNEFRENEIVLKCIDEILYMIDEKSNFKEKSDVLIRIIAKEIPKVVLFLSSRENRLVAGTIAAHFERGLTSDCIGLEWYGECLRFKRIVENGSAIATIESKDIELQFGIIFPNSFIEENCYEKIRTIEEKEIKNNEKKVNNVILEYVRKKEINYLTDIAQNDNVVIGGGLGMGSYNNFCKLRKLAALLGVGIYGTKAAYDIGWISENEIIGISGTQIKPEIYVAFGISGSIQHMLGVEEAKMIIAINNNQNSLIMKSADYYILSDASEVTENLINLIMMKGQ